MLTVEELIKLLRLSVNVQQKESGVIDPAYLALSDDDILLYLRLGMSRAFPSCLSVSDLPAGADYPIILLAKIELYTMLAVLRSDKVDLGADNNNYLKLSDRFKHYMALVSAAQGQYDSWLANEGQGEVYVNDLLLDKKHLTMRNYEKQSFPIVSLSIDGFTTDTAEFHWNLSRSQHFLRYKVYISNESIIDVFLDGASYEDKISGNAKCIKSTGNIHDCMHRVRGLSSNTLYYIAVVALERNGLWGYSQQSFTTLEEPEDEEDFSSDTLDGGDGLDG